MFGRLSQYVESVITQVDSSPMSIPELESHYDDKCNRFDQILATLILQDKRTSELLDHTDKPAPPSTLGRFQNCIRKA